MMRWSTAARSDVEVLDDTKFITVQCVGRSRCRRRWLISIHTLRYDVPTYVFERTDGRSDGLSAY